MTWIPVLLAAPIAAADAATSLTSADIIQFVTSALNLGVLGIVFWLFVQGRLHSDSEISRLTAENARLVAEKTHAEDQRDAALQIAQTQLVPLLVQFTATSGALLPLLQQLVQVREAPHGAERPLNLGHGRD